VRIASAGSGNNRVHSDVRWTPVRELVIVSTYLPSRDLSVAQASAVTM
jgi:hypothetical protein